MVKVIGMKFETVREEDLPKKCGIKVLYQAPNDGPKFWVDHYFVGGDLPIGKKREDIRIAFAKIIGGAVVWREDGYYTRAEETPVKWVQKIARFIPKTDEELEAETSPEFLEEDEEPSEID